MTTLSSTGISHLALVLAILSLGFAACEPPPREFEACAQTATREPLSGALLAFLPPIDRPDAVANADAFIERRETSLAGRESFAVPEPLTWKENPFNDKTWEYEFQSLFMVYDQLLAFQARGDAKYLAAADQLLEEWLSTHLDFDFNANWADHVQANRTRILLLAWELLRRENPTSHRVDDVCRALQVHGRRLSSEEEYTRNHNHGYFQDEALLLLSSVFTDHTLAAAWSSLARERVAAQIEYAVSPDGVHREHSPSYHAGMQGRFSALGRLLGELELGLTIDVDALVGKMWDYIAFAALPDGAAPLVGDSSRWFGSVGTPGITESADYSLSLGTQGAPAEETIRVFEDAGYAFFRDRWHPAETFDQTIHVGFIASFFSRAHKHCDDLSVIMSGYNHEWLVDSGLWSYNNDEFYDLSIRPAGHNVVEVDGLSYFGNYPTSRDGSESIRLITESDSTANQPWVRGEHRFNDGVVFARELTFRPPDAITVEDRLTAEDGKTHDYVLYWHIASDKTVFDERNGVFRVTATGDGAGPEMTLAITATSALNCRIAKGETNPPMGWHFPIFGEAVEASVIACSTRGQDVRFSSRAELASRR